MHSCSSIIEDFVAANSAGGGLRERHLLGAFLHALVRQAKAEHMLEIRTNAQRVLGLAADPVRCRIRRRAGGRMSSLFQRELEFDVGEEPN